MRDERGFVFVIMPFLILGLLTLFAFVTSAGLILTMKHQLQAAADAGAVAAVSARKYADHGDYLEEVIDPPRAEREARTLVNRNLQIMGLYDHPYRRVKSFQFRVLDENTVRVDLKGEVYLPFAKLLGADPWKDVSVYAEAQLRDYK